VPPVGDPENFTVEASNDCKVLRTEYSVLSELRPTVDKNFVILLSFSFSFSLSHIHSHNTIANTDTTHSYVPHNYSSFLSFIVAPPPKRPKQGRNQSTENAHQEMKSVSSLALIATVILTTTNSLSSTRTTLHRHTSHLGISTSSEQQHEFELKVGKALDTLRSDYPDILTESPGMLLTSSSLSSLYTLIQYSYRHGLLTMHLRTQTSPFTILT
jgi:hypothetical protein